jgi:hypothetical protein
MRFALVSSLGRIWIPKGGRTGEERGSTELFGDVGNETFSTMVGTSWDICSCWNWIDAAGDLEAPYGIKRTWRATKRMSSSESDRVIGSGMTMLLARAELRVNGPGFLTSISVALVPVQRIGRSTLSHSAISISGSKGSTYGALVENKDGCA